MLANRSSPFKILSISAFLAKFLNFMYFQIFYMKKAQLGGRFKMYSLSYPMFSRTGL